MRANLDAGKSYRITIHGDASTVNMSAFEHFSTYVGSGGMAGSFERVNISELFDAVQRLPTGMRMNVVFFNSEPSLARAHRACAATSARPADRCWLDDPARAPARLGRAASPGVRR